MTVFHRKGCVLCDNSPAFTTQDLAVGPRSFCSEKCYAVYTGLPVKPEGYYGLVKDE